MLFRQAPENVRFDRKHSSIRGHLRRWIVAAMCRTLYVSEQGYSRSLWRPERGRRDWELREQSYEFVGSIP